MRAYHPMDERAALVGGCEATHLRGDRAVSVSIAPELSGDQHGLVAGQAHQRTSPWVRALLLVGLVALVVTCAALTREDIASRRVATPRLVSPDLEPSPAPDAANTHGKNMRGDGKEHRVARAGRREESKDSKHRPDEADYNDYNYIDGEWAYDYEQWDGEFRTVDE